MSDNSWNPREVYKSKQPLNIKSSLVIVMFPEALTELHKEIQHHPPLLVLLHDQPDKDVYIQILEIAAYCKILVSGEYTNDDMLKLCETLTKKLRSMRTLIVLPLSL